MAQPIRCDICGETTADFMVSTIQDGSVVGVGVECLLDWALPIAEAYQAAVAREAEGTAGRDVVDTAGPDDWEEGYPQPETKSEGPPEGADEVEPEGSTEETETANVSE